MDLESPQVKSRLALTLALAALLAGCGCVYVASNGTYIKRERYIQAGTNTVNKLLHFDLDFEP